MRSKALRGWFAAFCAVLVTCSILPEPAQAGLKAIVGGGGGSISTILTNTACTAVPTVCGSFFGYSNPLWYGATGADNHDDSTAIDAAATAACSGGWKRVKFTYGTYLVLHQHASKCSGETFFADPQNAAYDGTNIHAATYIHVNNGFIAGWVSTNNCYYDQAGFLDQVSDGINYKADSGGLGTVLLCNSHNTQPGDQTPRVDFRNGSSSLFGATVGCSIKTSAVSGNAQCFTGTGTTQGNLVTARFKNWKFDENAVGVGGGNLTDLYIDKNSEIAGNACGGIIATINGTEGPDVEPFRTEENGFGGISGVCAAGSPAVEVTGPLWTINTQFQANNGNAVLFDNSCGQDGVSGGYSGDGQLGSAGSDSEVALNASCGPISFNGWVGSVASGIGQTAGKYVFENTSGTNTVSVIGGNMDSGQYTTALKNVIAGSLTISPLETLGQTPTTTGNRAVNGSTSGTITLSPQANAGTYNWNWPTTAGSSGQVLTSQGGGSTAMIWSAGVSAATLTNFLGGLTLSNDGVTPNTILDIATGTAVSDDSTTIMNLASAYTKTTGSWAVGTGNGALDTGSVANSTWYHVFAIERTDTGVVDILFSTSPTSPTMPTNYTVKRRIGSFKTDGSAHIIAFIQRGSIFYWTAAVLDMSSVSISTTASLNTLGSVPTGVIVQPLCRLTMSDAGHSLLITSPDEGDVIPTDTTPFSAAPGFDRLDVNLTNGDANSTCPFVTTNTSGQLRMRCSSGTCTTSVVTRGWVD